MTPEEAKILNRAAKRAQTGIFKPFQVGGRSYNIRASTIRGRSWYLVDRDSDVFRSSAHIDELSVSCLYETICRLLCQEVHNS